MSASPVHILAQYPDALRMRLMAVRALILEIAGASGNIGNIEESVKWGQLSFATQRPKSGTPIRLGGGMDTHSYSLFVPCSTSLIADFRANHPDMFHYQGNREIRLDLGAPLPKAELSLFISAALTYYQD